MKYVKVIKTTNWWGGTDYRIIDCATGATVVADLPNNLQVIQRLAERIDAQIAVEKEYGGYLGPNQ